MPQASRNGFWSPFVAECNKSPPPIAVMEIVKVSKKQEAKPTPLKEENSTVKAIKQLFWSSRTELEGNGQIVAARKIERQIAKLVTKVAAELPNSEAHGDALQFHYYMLLSLARMSKRAAVKNSSPTLPTKKAVQLLPYCFSSKNTPICMQSFRRAIWLLS